LESASHVLLEDKKDFLPSPNTLLDEEGNSQKVAEPMENESRNWPFVESKDIVAVLSCRLMLVAAYDFVMTKQEVSKRAAWAWARTAILYDCCADNLEENGFSQQALGLKEISTKRYGDISLHFDL
jgi:hypothetical protein